MDKTYVSEYTAFINGFLGQHPEVKEDQRRGWLIYWDHKIDLAQEEKALQDRAPEDGYGFYYQAWPGRLGKAGNEDGDAPSISTAQRR